MNTVMVAGVDTVKFAKPGQQKPYREMASSAIRGAISDAGIDPALIEQAYGGYIYGDSTCAQHALYDAFMTGVPVINVNNNCSSGSTAIFLARQAVQSGAVECALAFGFEEMQPGALGSHWDDRESPFDNFLDVLGNQGYRPPLYGDLWRLTGVVRQGRCKNPQPCRAKPQRAIHQ